MRRYGDRSFRIAWSAWWTQTGVAVNPTISTPTRKDDQSTPVPTWTPPKVDCYETRPEVTAYAGDGGPWNNR